MELYQTERGHKILCKAGEKVSKLIVQEYVGKRWFDRKQTYEPVYKCLCECGNITRRQQSYIRASKPLIKCCQACGKKASLAGAKKGGSTERKNNGETYYNEPPPTREEKVQQIIDEIFKFNAEKYYA